MHWYSLTGDSVAGRAVVRHVREAAGPATGSFNTGAFGPRGEFVFWMSGGYTLVHFASNGRFLDEFSSPTYDPELPNASDMDHFVSGYRRIFGTDIPPERAEEYRNKPKPALIPTSALRFDGAGRLWVATTRDREDYSYFDLFDGSRFVGSVRVRDRLLGYDILGDVLAVRVERAYADASGEKVQAIDWYDLTATRE